MNILSTMFITTAVAGSLCAGSLPENCDALQSGNSYNIGYIIGGTSSDCEKIIQNLLSNCGKPSTPENETPEVELPEVELPDAEAPGNKPEIETPDTESPDNSGSEESPELSLAEQVVALVNEERAAAGLNPLTINESAMSAALVRAREIRQSFSHTRPNGSSFSTALREQGVSYRGSGENIAYGQRSPEEVMKAWMNSSGHRANILNEKFTSIGVGCYEQNGVLYWTQLFIY